MAIVIIENKKYYSGKSIRNLVEYATDSKKTRGFIGAIGTNATDPQQMIQQMMAVKVAYEKCAGYRQARHIIVSFKDEEEVSPEKAYAIAYDIALFYADRYQICFGIHLNTDNIHIHFIQNTVCYVDGKMFSGAFVELDHFKCHVNYVISRYCCKRDIVQLIDELWR